ncbi:MAG: ABC transporter permease, partial [Solirubrobacteraceae bacterium]
LSPAVYVVIAGLVIAALASAADIGVDFGNAVLQAVATVPAVWTVVAVSVAVVGARPRVSIAAWAGVLISFVLTLLGPTFKLWDWILAISPFWHIPNVTLSDADWWGLLWISLVTLLFVAVGFAGFRRRDLAR